MRIDLRRPVTSCGARGRNALDIQLGLHRATVLQTVLAANRADIGKVFVTSHMLTMQNCSCKMDPAHYMPAHSLAHTFTF